MNYTMFEIKPIAAEAIPGALAKAERYRFLNEPREAESICRDVLRIDPGNQEAVVMLLLSLTDQFDKGWGVGPEHTRAVLEQLSGEYERAYYAGVVAERAAKAQLGDGVPGHAVYEWFRRAMEHYQRAEALSPAGNDDAVLRWNTCVRIIERHPQLRPAPGDGQPDACDEDVPGL